jgi:hypothetical protein
VNFIFQVDAPRFTHRGVLLDLARRFWPADALFSVLDAMASSKLNVLHLHITDAESFMFESLAFPPGLLTQRLTFSTTIQPPYKYYSLLKMGHPLQATGLLTQGVPGVPQDPLAPRRGTLGPSLDRERAIRNAPAL